MFYKYIMFDLQSLVKYLLEGLAVAAAAFYFPRYKSNPMEIVLIALTAAAVFAVLDQFAPSVAAGARQGTGLGIGFKMVSGGGGDGDDPTVPTDTSDASSEETTSTI